MSRRNRSPKIRAASAEDPEVAARIVRLRAIVEEALEKALPPAGDARLSAFAADRLVEAMRYSLTAPGKRLRPLLLLAAAEACGAEPAPLARFAAGVEMIHAYSLIHDDLPAMDDDELRRGRPTNHVVFGEAIAILAGDALLTEAFVAMLEPIVEPALQMRIVTEIAKAVGYRGMVGGQAADVLAEGREPDEELLRSIHTRKTGGFIAAAVRAGGMLAGAGDADLESLDRFAAHYGLAFQIADDVKDEIAPVEVTGKTGGGDKAAGKITYPALLGVPEARRRLVAELELAVEALAPLAERGLVLERLARDSLAPALGQR